MTLVSGTIPNLINGVSQQPQTVRNPSQATAQVNALSTASRGLRKRPGSNLVAVPGVGLPVANPDHYAAHAYKRTEDEQYHILVYGPTGQVRVTNLNDGTVVNLTNTYLITANAQRDIRFLTVADNTFILNTSTVVSPSASASAPLLDAAKNASPNLSDLYVVVAQGNYGKTYSVTINLVGGGAVTGSYSTPDGGSAAHSGAIATDNIAEQLRASLQANLTPLALAGVTLSRYGHVLHFQVESGAALSSRVKSFILEDGFAGQALRGFNQIIDDFSLLPTRASNASSPVKVVEGASKDNLGYYVRFESDAVGGTGVWRECESLYEDPDAGHNLPTPTTQRLSAGIDPSTLPLTLRNTGVNTFTLGTIPVALRKAGDSASAKQPSFVGETIKGMCFHRNRLGFISSSAVTLSESDNFFNLYPTTVIQVLDTDRIDVSANTTVVDDFHSAVAFDRDLFVFGARTQYRLAGEPLLTPKTVEMKLVTSFENDPQLTPRAVGSRILFGTTRGVYTGFRELYLTTDAVLDAPSITAAVPEYIPGNCRWMAASTTDDMMVVCPPEEDALYVHSFYFSGNEKLMSSWSRWEYRRADGSLIQPLHAEFLGSKLVVTTRNGEAVAVVTHDLSLGDYGDLGDYATAHMDFALDYTPATMSVIDNATRIEAVGLTIPQNTVAVVVDPSSPLAGQELPVSYDAGTNEYVIPGVDCTVFSAVRIGLRMEMLYEFSEVYFRRASPAGGTITDTLSRLSVRRFEVVFENSCKFTSQVTPEARPTNEAVFPRSAVASLREYSGEYPFVPKDGVYRFYVNTKNIGTRIVLRDDSAHPVNFLSATWEAQYVRHSKAV